MQAVQALLAGVFSCLLGLAVLIYLGQVLAEEARACNKTWMMKGRIQNGTIYKRDWMGEENIEGSGVSNKDWKVRNRIRNGRIYGRV